MYLLYYNMKNMNIQEHFLKKHLIFLYKDVIIHWCLYGH